MMMSPRLLAWLVLAVLCRPSHAAPDIPLQVSLVQAALGYCPQTASCFPSCLLIVLPT